MESKSISSASLSSFGGGTGAYITRFGGGCSSCDPVVTAPIDAMYCQHMMTAYDLSLHEVQKES